MGKHSFALLVFYVLITTMVHGTFEGSNEVDQWIQNLDNAIAKEKVTKLHFYFHDIQTGPNQSVVNVVQSPMKNSPTNFGAVYIMDDLLTIGPQPTSKQVGRAQGLYASAGLNSEDFALVVSMNLVFTSGRFNGSSLAILGRNPAFYPSRELPIVGGTGVFQLARGFATLSNHMLNYTTRNAIVEYNVVVIHY